MFRHFVLYSLFLTALTEEDQIDASRNSSSTLLGHNASEEDLLSSMLNPEFTFQNPVFVKELKGRRVIQKSRKQVNTTTIKESQYAKKIFIYRGSFLTLCSVSLGMYLLLILSVQIWILISRIEIKNGIWSLSPAERTTWWFNQVENLDDELEIDKMQEDIEKLTEKRSQKTQLFSSTAQDTKLKEGIRENCVQHMFH